MGSFPIRLSSSSGAGDLSDAGDWVVTSDTGGLEPLDLRLEVMEGFVTLLARGPNVRVGWARTVGGWEALRRVGGIVGVWDGCR